MRRFKRTTLISVGCLCLLLGIWSARYVALPALWPLPVCPGLLILRRKKFASVVAVIILGLALGLWRGGAYADKANQLKSLASRPVTIAVTANSDAVYGNNSQIEFTAAKTKLESGQSLAGSFKISGFGEPMVYRGDLVQVKGKLYLTRGSNQAQISYAQLQRLGADNNWINRFTRRFNAGMQSALPEPNASFGLGLIIGQRNNLPSDLTNALIVVGLVHIVAVSGYNLTVITRAISRLKLGSKYQRLVLSLALIAIFILMTGFSASIVRAAIVSTLGLWAWFYGRKFKPVVLIGLAAAITGFANPFYVWGDMSWYLSFLAFFGVLVIAPLLSRKLFARPPKLITLVLLETLSAELMTLPLIMMSFSQLSLIGLVANLLVVPLIPLAMLLCAVAAFAGMLVPSFAGWLAWPANWLLTYILDVIRLMSAIPGIFLRRSISPTTMIYFYVLVLLLTLIAYRQKHRAKPDII
jgi:competence protein ComEC